MKEIKKQTVEYVVEIEDNIDTIINDAKANASGVITFKTVYKKATKSGKPEHWIVTITEDLTELLSMNQDTDE